MKMKKWLPLLLVLAMLCLAGCQSDPVETTVPTTEPTAEPTTEPTTVPTEPPMDAQTLFGLYKEAHEAAPMCSADVGLSLDLSINMLDYGMTMSMKNSQSGTMLYSDEQNISYGELEVTSSYYGVETTTNVELYSSVADGMETSYQYDKDNDYWEKSVAEEEEGFLEYVMEDTLVLEEETQMLGDREVYVLHMHIGGESFRSSFTSFAEGQGVAFEEGRDSTGLDLSGVYGDAVIYIDAQTYQRLQMYVTIVGAEAPFSQIMTEASSQETDSSGISLGVEVTVNAYEISYENISYESVEVPQVSQLGIICANQYDFVPDQGDGSYVIQESGYAVRLTPPGNWVVYDALAYDALLLTKGASNYTRTCTVVMLAGEYDLHELLDTTVGTMESTYSIDLNTGDGDEINGGSSVWYRGSGIYGRVALIPIGEEGYLLVEVIDYTDSNPWSDVQKILEATQEYDLFAVAEEPAA